MVLGIVFLVIVGKMFSQYLNYRSEKKQLKNDMSSPVLSKINKQEKKIENLEKRIQIIESIVTDEEFKLNQKFKNL